MPVIPSENLLQVSALIVDDEVGSITALSQLLASYCPEVQVLACCQSVEEAISAIRMYQPQLLFLDIVMPPRNGLEVLEAVITDQTGVIVTSAQERFAIDAINRAMLFGYLLKPLRVDELQTAVRRAVSHFETQKQLSLQYAGRQAFIVQDARKGSLVIPVSEIMYCKAEGSFTDIFRLGKDDKIEKITYSGNLRAVEDRLPQLLFCRVHHSYLVNMLFVQRVERTGRNGCVHLNTGNLTVPVSVAKMDCFQNRLSHFFAFNPHR